MYETRKRRRGLGASVFDDLPLTHKPASVNWMLFPYADDAIRKFDLAADARDVIGSDSGFAAWLNKNALMAAGLVAGFFFLTAMTKR